MKGCQEKAKGEGRGHHGLRRRPCVAAPITASIRRTPPSDTFFAGDPRATLAAFGMQPYEGLASACCSAVSTRSSVSASLPASRVSWADAGSVVTACSSAAPPSSGVARLAAAPDALAALPPPDG